MLNELDKKAYIERYNERLSVHGYDPKTLGWGGAERQYLRFKTTLDAAVLFGEELTSILDIGCGFGDFCFYLKNLKSSIKYTGVDINESLIGVAKKEFRDSNFYLGTIDSCAFEDGSSDLVVENGIFNAKLDFQDQLDYIERTLREMFRVSKYGVAADFMTNRVDFIAEGAFHLDPEVAYRIGKSVSEKYYYSGRLLRLRVHVAIKK